jgi:colanic acid biosynthesis glycosyl transferase WcaI
MTEAGPQRPLALRFLALNHGPDSLGNAPLTTALSRGLAALGHRVEVFTAWPHHDTGRVPRGAWRSLGAHTEAGVRVVRVPVPGPQSTPLGRAATHGCFVAWAAFAAALRRLPEAVAGSGPEVQIVPLPPLSAAWIARPRGVPLVLDVQDVFPLNLAAARARETAPSVGTRPAALALSAARAFAVHSHRRADHLRTCGPAADAALGRLGVPAHRLTAIPNPARLDGLDPTGPRSLRAHLSPDGGPVVLLSGRLGAALDLEGLAAAWPQVLAAWPGAAGPAPWLALVGAGRAAAEAERRAQVGPRTRFLPLQPVESLGDLLRSCEVGLVPLRPGAALASLPSRTLSLWGCARPVVLCAEAHTDAAAQVRAAGGGVAVPPGDAQALAHALLHRLLHPGIAAAEGRSGHTWVQAHATPERVAAQWSAMLTQVAARGAR